MRIAQVSHSLECGGSMAMVVALSSKLAELGHEVDVVCLDRPTGSDHEQLWRKFLDQRRVSSRFLGRKAKWPGFVSALKFWWLVQRRKYDVVHSHLPMPDAITGLVRRFTTVRFKHVLTVHNTYEPRSTILAALGSGANTVYCSEAANRRNPVSGASSNVIPNGIAQPFSPTSCVIRAETRRHLELPQDAIVVIAIGRLCAQKNFDAAIDAIAILERRPGAKNLRYLFCGDGHDKRRLETRARDLGIDSRVQFLGNRTDIPALLAASDIFLSTSIHEGMPLTVLEALHAGLPCVLSSIDEHYEIAKGMPGCSFAPPNAPEEIASALDAAVNEATSPSDLRSARATLLERFSIERCAASYLSLYQSLYQVKIPEMFEARESK